MEENELRKLIEDGFKRIDERFTGVDERFTRIDQQFTKLRREFSEQLDGMGDGLHAETRALKELIVKKANEGRAAVEALDSKIGLLGENVGNVRTQLAQYHHRFEAPLEARVTKLEAQVWTSKQKSRRRS